MLKAPMRLFGQYGIVLVTAVVVMAWGTSPCLYADIVSKLADGGAGCCCDCCCDQGAPRTDTDDCPACGENGAMHELPPVGDPVTLDPPTVDFDTESADAGSPGRQSLEDLGAPPGQAPPLVAFGESVSHQR
jgi:hypothetical protein